MKKETYRIRGMHCASCAATIEKTFKKTIGVESAEVNFGSETAKIVFDEAIINPSELAKKIEYLGYSLVTSKDKLNLNSDNEISASEMRMSPEEHKQHLGLSQSKKEKLLEIAEMRRKVLTAIPLAIFSIFVMAWDILTKFQYVNSPNEAVMGLLRYLMPIIATYMMFVVGKPYLLGLWRFLRYGKANMDSLIGLGTFTAYIYSFIITAFEKSLALYINTENTYFDVAIVVIAFITFGKYLEARSKIKTGDAIEKLLNLQAKTAIVIRNNKEQEISINEVMHGDVLVVKPGARIPVDGMIVDGKSFVDEAMITGESMPIEKKIGDSVVAGTINTTGSFSFRATKVGAETLLAHIIKMVEEAQSSKAPIQALADKISAVFVPTVLAISFVALGLWILIGSNTLGFSSALFYGLTAFVGVLVIACPCALGLATPTAIIVGVGKGAREGILIKDAATLEKLHKVDIIVADKTGTITKGKPELVDIKKYSEKSEDEIISILASLESKSEHPIAYAIVEYAKLKNIEQKNVSGFEIIKGKGLKGIIDGEKYFAGNIKMVLDLGISFDAKDLEKGTSEGKTPVILTTNKNVLGVFMVADAIKTEAIEAIKSFHKMGIKIIMLTGDNKNTAQAIAKEIRIDDVRAEVLPDDKLNEIKKLQDEGHIVAMAGDGVNDAPALAQADVGIAMGTGTDVAIETAGITLLHGDISKIVKAIKLSKLTMRGIKQNLFWAFAYNIIGIPLASGLFYPIFGWMLSPIFAGLAMALSSVSVVSNSLRIKSKKI